MNIIEWRTNGELVKKAAMFLNDPLFIEMLRAVETLPLVPPGIVGTTPDDKALVLGKILGYRDCLDTIRSLGTKLDQPRHIETTFASPDE
jgi:hypothetical protein